MPRKWLSDTLAIKKANVGWQFIKKEKDTALFEATLYNNFKKFLEKQHNKYFKGDWRRKDNLTTTIIRTIWGSILDISQLKDS